MLIATLTTNIAANVIAPANAFSNLWPKKISFKTGGLITGIIGIAIFPWLLLDQISSLLLFVSGLLGPVLGIMLCDYYVIRRTQLDLDALYDEKGIFAYGGSGFNRAALLAFRWASASHWWVIGFRSSTFYTPGPGSPVFLYLLSCTIFSCGEKGRTLKHSPLCQFL
ncbi:MAG: cytosine permease [Saprospirales bacterium]|nr:cytosine permease [Saprospirales bacterium]